MTVLGADTESDMLSDHEILLPPKKRISVTLHFTDTLGTFSTKGELAVSVGVITDVDGKPLHTIPEFLTVVGQVYSGP